MFPLIWIWKIYKWEYFHCSVFRHLHCALNFLAEFQKLHHGSFFAEATLIEISVYRDAGYTLWVHLQELFGERVLTPQQQAYNGSMSAVCCSVEWHFPDIVDYFKFLDFKRNVEIGLKPSRQNVQYLCNPSKCFHMLVR